MFGDSSLSGCGFKKQLFWSGGGMADTNLTSVN